MKDTNDVPSRLERIAASVAGAIIGAEYFLCYNNFDGLHKSVMDVHDRFRWLPISESYFGDTPEIFTAILASSFVANRIEEYGEKRESKLFESLGRYFPALTAAAIGMYYTLGETVLPQLLPGTADIKDVPAVILTAVTSPFVANYVRKEWKNNWRNEIKNLVYSINSSQ